MNKSIPKILSGTYIVVMGVLLADAYNSPTKLYRYTGISSVAFAVLIGILFLVIRVINKQTLSSFISKINTFVILPLSLILSIYLTIYTYNSPPNYVFVLFHIQFMQICFISIFSGFIFFLQKSDEWYEKYYRQFIFAGAFIAFFYAFLASLFPFGIFAILSKEDNLIENTQVVILVFATIYAALISLKFRQKKRSLHFFLFVLLTFSLFFVAGEEISWGQRIFHIPTPYWLSVNNTQKELTVHNLKSIGNSKVNLGYILIGFYGAFGWIIPILLPALKKRPFSFYRSPWYIGSYFFLGFAYNLYIRLNPNHTIGVWGEFMELMIYSGLLGAVADIYYHQLHSLQVKTKWEKEYKKSTTSSLYKFNVATRQYKTD